MLPNDIYYRDGMNYINSNNIDNSPEADAVKILERQPELLKYFTPEFVEKHKHSYLFIGVMVELAKGANPYSIIQQLIEHLASGQL
jgi:hypothetical protein